MTSHYPDAATNESGASFFSPDATSTDTIEPAGDGPGTTGDDFDDLEDEFAPQPRRKLGKLTVLLAAVLVGGLGVIGGVELQKHLGTSSSAASGCAALARGGTGGTSGFPGGGSFPGGGGSTSSSSTGSGSTATTPAVIGQIASISGQTMVVKNLGGKEVTVHLTNTTTITKSYSAPALAAGQTVSVAGTTGTDSSVTATSVTVQ